MIKNCEWCNNEFKTVHKIAKYCSKECGGKGRSQKAFDEFKNGERDLERKNIKKHLYAIKGYKCEVCGLDKWLGKPLPLQLDHVDGNSTNNDLTNLRLICGNCHSQTPHYAGKNRGNGRKSKGYKLY